MTEYVVMEDVYHSVSDDTESFIVIKKGTIVNINGTLNQMNSVTIGDSNYWVRKDQLELKND